MLGLRTIAVAGVLLALGCGRWGFDDVAGLGGDGGAGGGGGGDIDAAGDPVLFNGPGNWQSYAPPGAMQATQWTRAEWTGSEFIAWGGSLSGLVAVDTGGRLDPATGQFTEMSTVGATARHSFASAWTGTEFFVYGGASGTNSLNGANLYDPDTDSWRTANSVDQPGARTYTTAVWTGARAFVWGGWGSGHHDNGALYDPVADQWTPVSMTGAPSARSMHGAVRIDGGRVLIWGGCTTSFPGCASPLADGAIYDPGTDSWTPISTVGAPSPRSQPGMVWNGFEVIVWGGSEDESASPPYANTGGAYDPSTDTWRTITTDGAPSAATAPGAVALGNSAVFFGGSSGGIYDPFADSWQSLASGGPSGRARFGFAAGGNQLFIWGGSLSNADGYLWTPEL